MTPEQFEKAAPLIEKRKKCDRDLAFIAKKLEAIKNSDAGYLYKYVLHYDSNPLFNAQDSRHMFTAVLRMAQALREEELADIDAKLAAISQPSQS